jgi:hypothetical protein
MTIIKEINLAIFPVNIFVLCTNDWSTIIPTINKHIRKTYQDPTVIDDSHIPEEHQCTPFVLKVPHHNAAFLIYPFYPEETVIGAKLQHVPTLAAITAHEALHITSEVMHHTGIRWDHQNDEVIAYLTGHITKHAITIFLAFLYNLGVGVTL